MLKSLLIKNIALVSELKLEFPANFVAITGETGAGKSILLNSLALCLGARMEQSMIKPNADHVAVYATFLINDYPEIIQWAKEQDITIDTAELILSRVWKNGVTKSYINNKQFPLTTLAQIGLQLVDIHGQGAHHLLSKKENHSKLLDKFANAQDISSQVRQCAKSYNELNKQIEQFQQQQRLNADRLEWLQFQLEEMAEFAITAESVQQAQTDFDRLAASKHNLDLLAQMREMLQPSQYDETGAVLPMLSQVIKLCNELQAEPKSEEIEQRLTDASQEITDIADSVMFALDNCPTDLHQLEELEQNMSCWLKIAHKHHVDIEGLPDLQQKLQQETVELKNKTTSLDELCIERDKIYEKYVNYADQLSNLRMAAVDKLTEQIQQGLANLNMGNMLFHVGCYTSDEKVTSNGNEVIEFLMAPAANYPLKPMVKIASGGELSRISLVIQVILAKVAKFGTIIFDEVDVGIGGSAAEKVGTLLAELGHQAQVICITHQAQVAALAQHQFYVQKHQDQNELTTSITNLTPEQRTTEIARMLGGTGEEALLHAKAMLRND